MNPGAYPARSTKPRYQARKKTVAGSTKRRLRQTSSWNSGERSDALPVDGPFEHVALAGPTRICSHVPSRSEPLRLRASQCRASSRNVLGRVPAYAVGHADSVRRDALRTLRKDARSWEHSETRRLRTGGDMAAQPGRTGESDVLERPIDWERAERSPEFRELVAAKRRFVIPATIFFLAWYLGFVLLAGYAPGLHGRVRVPGPDRRLLPRAVAVRHGPRAGHLVPAQGRARLRPARREGGERARWRPRRTPAVPPGLDGRRRRGRVDRGGAQAHDRPRRSQRRGGRHLRDRRLDHAGDHVVGVQAHDRRRHVLGRRPLDHGPAERPGHLRRLPQRRVLPGHRGADLPLRLRRLPVLRRLPRRVPDGHVPAGRAHAQRGQVHDRRRPQLPPARSARRAPRRRSGRWPSSPSTSSRRWSARACSSRRSSVSTSPSRCCSPAPSCSATSSSAACWRRRGCRSSRPCC